MQLCLLFSFQYDYSPYILFDNGKRDSDVTEVTRKQTRCFLNGKETKHVSF